MMVSLLLLLACAPEPWQPAAPELDEYAVGQTLGLLDPGFAMELLHGMPELLSLDDCEPATFDDGEGLRETWTACPGGEQQGAVERYEDRNMAWLEAAGLQLQDIDGTSLIRMDGAVEYTLEEDEQGLARIARLDLAASLCTEDLCDPQDEERLHLDLGWTLVPDGGVAPHEAPRSDMLLSGTLMSPSLGPALVEGSWSVDAQRCDIEPVSGLVLLRAEQTHAFEFNGDAACDGCAVWTLDGEDQGTLCPE